MNAVCSSNCCASRTPNSLSHHHQVPNMFPYDERAALLEMCRVASKKEGMELDSAVDLWNYFVDKTRENLHVVLCFRCAVLCM